VIQKSSNWFILNRRLAELVTTYPPHRIDLEFSEIYCPEEHYFITRICQNGLQSEIDQTPNLAEDATTFTNWADMSYQFVSRSGLKSYSKISKAELTHLLKSRCLFGRKFLHGCRGLHRRFYLESIRSAGGMTKSTSLAAVKAAWRRSVWREKPLTTTRLLSLIHRAAIRISGRC
jgi:hypothetical protein